MQVATSEEPTAQSWLFKLASDTLYWPFGLNLQQSGSLLKYAAVRYHRQWHWSCPSGITEGPDRRFILCLSGSIEIIKNANNCYMFIWNYTSYKTLLFVCERLRFKCAIVWKTHCTPPPGGRPECRGPRKPRALLSGIEIESSSAKKNTKNFFFYNQCTQETPSPVRLIKLAKLFFNKTFFFLSWKHSFEFKDIFSSENSWPLAH